MNDKLISLLETSRTYAHDLRCYLKSNQDWGASYQILEHMEELKGVIRTLEHESNTTLACDSEEAHTQVVSEHDKHCLPEALHGLQVELVRTTGELRSLLLILSKLDLGNTEKTNMKISELAGSIGEVKTATLKALGEIRNRIDAADARIVILETQLADADIPPAAETALAELKTISKQLDDIVPDVTELPPVVTPPTPA